MKNIAVLNAIGVSGHAFEALIGGKNSFQICCDYARSLPQVDEIAILTEEGLSEEVLSEGTLSRENLFREAGHRLVTGSGWTERKLLEALRDLACGYDNIFYFHADCPFLDTVLTRKMLDIHTRYCADYTNADGYPYGLAPEILRGEIVEALMALAQADSVQRGSVFSVIQKDINSFDIETEIAPRDQRLLRVSLAADTKRNLLLLQRIVGEGGQDAPSVARILEHGGRILRTLPAYLSVQIVDGVSDRCVYDPYVSMYGEEGGKRAEMSAERFEQLLQQVCGFCEDATVTLAAFGEPALHTEIAAIVQIAASHPQLRLIIETSGKGWRESDLAAIERGAAVPLTWIIYLDALDKNVYASIRGDGYEEANAFAQRMLAAFPQTYLQAVRMQENEEDLEQFYKTWRAKTEHVIIQKYDSVCGLLPDRRVTDLAPLKRFPCWHLKRDLHVRVDGSVPLCVEDVTGRLALGNIFEQEIGAIWERGEVHYLAHLDEQYPDLCSSCDEYYTYNF